MTSSFVVMMSLLSFPFLLLYFPLTLSPSLPPSSHSRSVCSGIWPVWRALRPTGTRERHAWESRDFCNTGIYMHKTVCVHAHVDALLKGPYTKLSMGCLCTWVTESISCPKCVTRMYIHVHVQWVKTFHSSAPCDEYSFSYCLIRLFPMYVFMQAMHENKVLKRASVNIKRMDSGNFQAQLVRTEMETRSLSF